MSESRANLVAGISAILTIVLIIAGFGVIIGASPGLGASAEEIDDFLRKSEVRIWVGGYVEFVAFFFYVIFIARLWAIVRRAEAGSGWLSMAALGSGLISIAVGVGIAFTAGAAAFYTGRRGLDPAVVGALIDMRTFGFFLSQALIGLFLVLLAVLVLLYGGLPRWVGWSAAVVGALSIVLTPTGSVELIGIANALYFVWLVVVGVLLIVRRDRLASA